MKKCIICLLAAPAAPARADVSASVAVYANVIDTAELLSERSGSFDARCSRLQAAAASTS